MSYFPKTSVEFCAQLFAAVTTVAFIVHYFTSN